MASLVNNELEHWKYTVTSMVRVAAMQEVAVLYCFSIYDFLGIVFLPYQQIWVVQNENILVSIFLYIHLF